MRKIARLLCVLLGALYGNPLLGQQTIEVQLSDSIKLEADSFRGSIQWQLSTDNETWNDVDQGIQSPHTAVITTLPSFYRAKISEEGCIAHYSETISAVSTQGLLWSDATTWGNAGKPIANQEVIIPAGVRILLDETPPDLGGLTINGILEFDRQDLSLTSEWIVIDGGILEIGTEANPFEQKAIITLNDTEIEADPTSEEMGTRGIIVISGSLELHGATPDVIWTKINAHATAGSTTLELIESVNWKINDEIVIAPTDYYEAGNGISLTQRVELTDVSGQQLTLADGLNAFRWGLLQYATNSGMSLTQTDMAVAPVADTDSTATPLILDERAEVGNMSRNIVIQSPDDDLWNDQGFGAHTMIMPAATAHVEGVEFKRGGQRSRLRRYPFHWHMLSYAGTETLADATGQYFRKNTINSSSNRGVVIHGTNGVLVQDNIIYDIRGHGIFTEDAVERRNVIDGNLVLRVRKPFAGTELKQHEVGTFGASGLWISNPDNTITNNTSADCSTFGFWLAFPDQPWGLNTSVLHEDGLVLRPNRLLFGVFDNNTSHSNGLDGIMLDNAEIDTDGNTSPRRYRSTTDGREIAFPNSTLRRFTLARYKTWKNRDNGIWDRAEWVNNFEVVSADNCGRFFGGSGMLGLIERCLVVGTSLNQLMNGTGRPASADFHAGRSSASPAAFATYHSTFDIRNNIVVQFEAVAGYGSGTFSTDDYYLLPIDKGHIRNSNNLRINAHPGVKLQSVADHFTLASAIWDPNGIWGPANNYFVYDDPFIVYGKTTIEVEGGAVAGGVSVPGPFYGFEGFVLHGRGDVPPQNQPWKDLIGINVRRLDENLNEVAAWNVEPAILNELLDHMRDFITSPDGIYELTFFNDPLFPIDFPVPPTDFQMNVFNMLTDQDLQVMGIEFDGNLTANVFMGTQAYSQVNSLVEVINSIGETYWQDNASNRVWVKMQGGTRTLPADTDPLSDEALYETTVLQITPQ